MRDMEQKKKVINTTNYLVTQMDAVRALKVQTKLVKILGSSVLSLISGGIDSKDKIKEALPKIIPSLMNNFDDEVVTNLVLSLFEKGVFTEVSGQPKVLDFSDHFAGKASEMWQVVYFILEANFISGESIESSSPTTGKVNLTPGS